MAVVFATCPVCKQRLGVQEYVVAGSELVCANCEANLRVERLKPLRLVLIPVEETFNVDSRPESYG